MKIDLNKSWCLSDEPGGASCDSAVLVDKESGEIYGPGALVRADPSGKYVRAVRVVDQCLEGLKRKLTEKETALVRKFFLQ